MIYISKLLGRPQPPPPPPPTPVATASEIINRKTLTDLRFVKCYPCKCHDFVNQFILTIQLYYIFCLTTKILLCYYCRNFPNGQPGFPNMLILKKSWGLTTTLPPNTPIATALGPIFLALLQDSMRSPKM